MSRKIPDDSDLFGRYADMYGFGKNETQEEIIELAKKQSKKYEDIVSELRYKWLCDEIKRDIDNAIITKELTRATAKWDDIEAIDKKLTKLWEELEQAARDYVPKKET